MKYSETDIRQLFVRIHSDLNGAKENEDEWVCAFVGEMLGCSALEVGLVCINYFDGRWKPYVKGVTGGSARP